MNGTDLTKKTSVERLLSALFQKFVLGYRRSRTERRHYVDDYRIVVAALRPSQLPKP